MSTHAQRERIARKKKICVLRLTKLPYGSAGKEYACSAGHQASITGLDGHNKGQKWYGPNRSRR